MDTHSKKLFIRILFLIIAFVAGLTATAQHSLYVSVLPPYTNRLADYANTPNKVVVVVAINGAAAPNYSGNVYFRGKLRSVSGDIEISTKAGFKPQRPVSIPTGPNGMPQPYTMTFSEIQNLFDWNNLNFIGIDLNRVVQYGMPEDLYQFCIEVVDYITDEVLIEEQCGSPFNVAMLEPPIIISPANESTITNTEAQNMLFNWTLSPGAPITTNYTLRIVEMIDGVNPNEALSFRNYPRKHFETSVRTPTYLYTGASPKLEPGKTYAFAVVAEDPVTQSIFRNNGMSEIHMVKVEGMTAVVTPDNEVNEGELAFVKPNSTDHIAEINSKNTYALSWLWKELISQSQFNEEKLKEYCQNLNLKKYRLTIDETAPVFSNMVPPDGWTPATGVFTKDFPINYDSTTIFAHTYVITNNNAESSGLIEARYYKATVQALTDNNEVVSTAVSVPFRYMRIPEDNTKYANVHAVVDYKFEGRPGIYHAVNTPVTVEAYRIQHINNNTPTSTENRNNQVIRSFANNLFPFATITAQTNSNGELNVDFPLTNVNVGDSILFLMKTDSKYYLYNNFSEVRAIMVGDSTSVNFGPQLAQVYGYSLKLNIKKSFTLTDDVEDFPEGVTVVMYRKDKKDYIPPIEGDINSYIRLTGDVEVARAKTITEVINGKKSAFVEFHNLLAIPSSIVSDNYFNNLTGDEYYFKALNTDEVLELQTGTTGTSGSSGSSGTGTNRPTGMTGTTATNRPDGMTGTTGINMPDGKIGTTGTNLQAINNNANISGVDDLYINNITFPAYTESGFIAQQKMFFLRTPVQYNADSLYRNVTATYEIETSAPPTSRVQGSLSYKWYSDPNAVVRPMANINFNVVVDYLVNDETICLLNYYKDAIYESFIDLLDGSNIFSFQRSDGSVIKLLDGGKVEGSGKTDNNGNFNINLNNFSSKGDLGTGTLYKNGVSLGVKNLKRVFRIVPQSPYYYPSMDHFIVQPLEFGTIATQCSYVREVSYKASPDKNLTQITMLIFRDSTTRTADMPAGEGEGNHPMKELLNPQYNTQSLINASDIETTTIHIDPITGQTTTIIGKPISQGNEGFTEKYGSEVFTKKFEYVCEPKKGGEVTFTGLLPTFNDYYIEACSNTAEGTTDHYKASFNKLTFINNPNSHSTEFPVNTSEFYDPELWMGKKSPIVIAGSVQMIPLESRIFVRSIDESSNQALPNARVLIYYRNDHATIITDNDGYLQVRASESPLKEVFESATKDALADFYNNVDLSDPSTVVADYANALSEAIKIADNIKITFDMSAKALGYHETNKEIINLKKKGEQLSKTLPLKPAGTLNINTFSTVGSASTIPVKSYIKIDSATMNTTNDDGSLTILIPRRTGTKIYIIPHDLAYFNDTITITELKNIYNYNVELKRKKHRIRLEVTDKDSGEPIMDYTAALGDEVKKSPNRGIVNFEFENVSVNNYTFIIRGPQNSSYIPVAVNIKNEETKDPVKYKIQLEKGSTIWGEVKFADNRQPVRNAKVYLDIAKETTPTVNVPNQEQNTNNDMPNLTYANPYGATQQSERPPAQQDVTISAQGNSLSDMQLFDTSASEYELTKKDMDLLIAYTDEQGRYTLRGIPVNNSKVEVFATLDTSFTVIGASQQANIVDNVAQMVNLSLKKYEGMYINNLYGFPISIESLTPQNDGGKTVKVTGLVEWGAGISDFSVKDDYKQLRVENVTFKAETVNGKQVGFAVDESVKMQGITSLKLGYLDGKYNILLMPSIVSNMVQELTIKRSSEGKGSISGKMSIIDNSFNYTASYLNFEGGSDFYLATKEGGTLNNVIEAIISPLKEEEASSLVLPGFDNSNTINRPIGNTNVIDNPSSNSNTINRPIGGTNNNDAGNLNNNPTGNTNTTAGFTYNDNSGTSRYQATRSFISSTSVPEVYRAAAERIILQYPPEPTIFHLSDVSGGPINFELLEFVAFANPDSSYIDHDGKIHLNVDLSCEIPNANPSKFSVNVKDIVLDNNNVYAATGSQLDVKLGKWTLEVKDWTLDPKEGGIFSTNSLLRTEAIDVPVRLFNLRHDLFVMDNFDFSSLKLGGNVAEVKIGTNSNKVLQWDSKVGIDLGGHWRLSVTNPSGQPAAFVTGLNNHLSENIKISYLQILDNNEATVTLAPNQVFNLKNNPLAKFKPQSLYNGSNHVDMAGTLDIGAPVMSDMTLKLEFTKPGSVVNMELKRVTHDFAPNGKVHFTAREYRNNPNIRIDQRKVEIDGYLSANDAFNRMPALLTADNTPPAGSPRYRIDISNRYDIGQPWTTNLEKGYNNVDEATVIKKGFRLENVKGGMTVENNNWTKLEYFGDLVANDVNNNGLGESNLKFTVYDEVKVESTVFRMKGIGTPFGNLDLKYEIQTGRLIGTLDVKNLALEPIYIKKGTVEFMLGLNGFYVAGGLDTDVHIPLIQGPYQMGFMAGYCQDEAAVENVWENVVNKYKSPYLKNVCYLDEIKSKLSGFYFGIERIFFQQNLGFDIGIYKTELHSFAGAAVDLYANFSPDEFRIGVSGSAVLRVQSSLIDYDVYVAELKLEGQFDGKAAFDFAFVNGHFTVDVYLGMAFKMGLTGCALGICKELISAQVNCRAAVQNDKFKFEFGGGGIQPRECAPFNSNK